MNIYQNAKVHTFIFHTRTIYCCFHRAFYIISIMYSISNSLKSSSLSFLFKQAEVAIYLVSLFNRLQSEWLKSGCLSSDRKMNLQFVMSSASVQVLIHEISCLAVQVDATVKIHTVVCKLSLSLFLVSMIMLLVDSC